MKKRNLKALYNLNAYIDEESQKLSDKVKNLELSRNRMRKLLKMCKEFLEKWNYSVYDGYIDDSIFLHRRLTLELYGLEGYKGLKGGKK